MYCIIKEYTIYVHARMAELVDAQVSNTCRSNPVRVRFSLRAPTRSGLPLLFCCFFYTFRLIFFSAQFTFSQRRQLVNIGLDFDGVISDCGRLKSEGAERLYGITIPPEKFKKEIVVGEGHLTLDEYRELQRIIYGTREYGLLMEPVEGALLYIPRLVQDGHSVTVITSRGPTELEIAKEWSAREGFTLELIGVGGDVSKADAATKADLDVYADDDLDKLEPLVGIVRNRFLFSWGYNAHIDVRNVATRVASWEDLYEAI